MPPWLSTAAISSTGTVFVAAAIADNEHRVFMCACFDNTPLLVANGDHVYVQAEWLAREYPKVARTCEAIITRVRREHDT